MRTPKSNKTTTSKPRTTRRSSISQSLVAYPFPCMNCDETIPEAVLFCSPLCREEAKFVRYYRACIQDRRIKQPDIQEALQIRLAHILAGGYRGNLRQLSSALRKTVIDRDHGRCRRCGAAANQIDHIDGDSNDLDNLQLLCERCHNEKTMAHLVQISPDTHPEEWARRDALLSRVASSRPTRLCDGSEWNSLWRVVYAMRRQAFNARAAISPSV